ncbi:tRNA 5-hydroxyuridine modification protein YegQ [Rhodocyclus purpureus]|uniref:prephenate-dependent tRNA uridine(34) hydroxylase TrhP n=1 Tax=Rhodocyclus purpureus TaxID=1067 RepID=UPI0019125473|nr:tRNA 5-hydroxyuridine modification protein YegQ [Rhodocyclus purpureus]MBK5915017.1 U32 family peptidase [Rhodocyclus purpureus]
MSAVPELLAPAGSLAMARAALAFGADALYAGPPRYSLRVRNNEFGDPERLAQAIDETHALGRRFYMVVNALPHNSKLKSFHADLAPLVALAPDALIMADPGLIDLTREAWPQMPIHLSVQANTMNWAAVRFWHKQGIERVILSRELSLDEIAEIRQRCPEVELEVFVHGALCIAHSGRCLLSGYFNRRDANQGSCTNACRWQYQVHAADADGNPLSAAAPAPADGQGGCAFPGGSQWLIEERERPGELMPIEEDEHGTYILNSKDLRAIEHVERLVAIGVDSLKIEGRTKSAYYAARTTQAYRRALDDARAGRPFDPGLLTTLDALASRGYTEGFYRRHLPAATQNYASGASAGGLSRYVGDVVVHDAARGLCEVAVRNRFAVGDRVEIVQPAGNRECVVERMEDAAGRPVGVAPGDGHRVWIALPADCVGAYLARFEPPAEIA